MLMNDLDTLFIELLPSGLVFSRNGSACLINDGGVESVFDSSEGCCANAIIRGETADEAFLDS